MKKQIIFIIIILSGLSTQAQQDLSLHFSKILQSQSTNPALFSEKSIVIGLPGLAVGYGNNAFAYGDLIKQDPNSDSTFLNLGGVIDQMEDQNYLRTQLNVDYFRFAYTNKKWYISFQISDKLDTKFGFGKGLAQLFWYGNAPFLGEELSLSPVLDATYYREISLGGGLKIGDLQIGARAKLLAGLAQANAAKSTLSVITDPEDYDLQLSADYLLQTSGIEAFANDPLGAASSFENTGMGLDLGALYKLDDDWTFQASVTNLGFINWKNSIRTFSVKGEYEFTGINIEEFLQNDSLYFSSITDTLSQTFSPEENNDAYRNNLAPRYFLSASWEGVPSFKFGILLFGEWFDGFKPAMALYAGKQILPFWEAGITYVAKNGSPANLGLQTNANLGPIQLYVVTDHLTSILNMRNARNVNLRVGINLTFKKIKQK